MRFFPNAKRTKQKLMQEFSGKKILDVGCGQNKTKGTVGIDRRISPEIPLHQQCDIEHNLLEFPWPIPDSSYDLIICQHVIEHLPDTVKTFEEFHRILTPNGKIFIETPHYTWFEAYRHYEHCHMFSFQSFDYFLKGNRHYKTSFQYTNKTIFFDDFTFAIGLGFLANWFPRFYEKRLAFIFPATSFQVTLQVDKN